MSLPARHRGPGGKEGKKKEKKKKGRSISLVPKNKKGREKGEEKEKASLKASSSSRNNQKKKKGRGEEKEKKKKKALNSHPIDPQENYFGQRYERKEGKREREKGKKEISGRVSSSQVTRPEKRKKNFGEPIADPGRRWVEERKEEGEGSLTANNLPG